MEAGSGTEETRIVVLEREHVLRDSLVHALTADGSVTCVGTGWGSGTPVAVAEGAVDAVLVHLPTPGGPSEPVVRQVRDRFPAARLVVVTAHVDAAVVEVLVAAGATAVLATAVPLDAVRAALTGRAGAAAVVESRRRGEHAAERAVQLGITPRQHEVLRLLAVGAAPGWIARDLDIRLSTCRDHLKALHRALDATSSVELVLRARRAGLVPEMDRPVT